MKTLALVNKNTKEIIRDPLTLFFGVGFPLVLLLLLSAIQANVPVSIFEIEHLAPGITVFGLSFMTLFSATIISKDRGSALLQRLYTTPLTPLDFILGYSLPLIPISVMQSIVCYAFAIILGLDITVNILFAWSGTMVLSGSRSPSGWWMTAPAENGRWRATRKAKSGT